MATLKTSLEANCDRQAGRQTEEATYRGLSYHSAQKLMILEDNLKKRKRLKNKDDLKKLDNL